MRNRIYFILITFAIIVIPHAAGAEGYIIGDEDVLQISVWGNQELSVQVPVRPDGMISVPLLGDVKATGSTPQELKINLEKELSRYVKAPVVSVIVTSVNSFKVYVFGEGISGTATGGSSATTGGSATSGQITLRRNTTLLQLLAQVGSLRNADLDNAYIRRGDKKLAIDFNKLVTKGDISQDIPLVANDVIFIPDNFNKRVRIVGEVRTPTTIPYIEGMTALDAILSAGGFTEYASKNSVIIVRKEGNSVKNIEVNVKDVINGDARKNAGLLKPGDIVNVKASIF